MRSIIAITTFLFIAHLALPSALATKPAPAACSSKVHRQFDFWIGTWIVKTPDGKVAGRNKIEKILEGCVLRESWRSESGRSVGHSFNIFAKDKKWHQTWVDNSGLLLELVGGLDAKGRMVMSQDTVDAKGHKIRQEISWTRMDGGKVRQHWRSSSDGGKTWKDVFVGIYEPEKK